jgi:formylmethanofuran dehydrogenase subunit C
MALRLVYQGDTRVPVEMEGFVPDWAADKPLAEIEKFGIFHGNRKVPLAEFFKVSGNPTDLRFDFEGNLAGVHWIGSHMKSGSITVHGPAGRHTGSEMRGGSIAVEGSAGDWVGAEMRNGLIHVRGDAGHFVGAAYRGSAKGMTGGTILIDGTGGNEIGHTMRRGTIAVGGDAGDMIGFNMIAGTILVFGKCGIRPGAGMRRGTIGILGPDPPPMLSSFRFGSTYRPQFLGLLLKELHEKGFRVPPKLLDSHYDLYHGDLVALGKGEILLPTVG